MKQHPTLTQFITSLLIYGLISIIFITGLGCGLAFNLAPQVSGLMSEPTSNRTWQKVHLPTLTPTPIGIYFDVRPDPTDGFIDARDLIEWVSRTRGSDGAADLLFEFSVYWQRAYPPLKESGKEVE